MDSAPRLRRLKKLLDEKCSLNGRGTRDGVASTSCRPPSLALLPAATTGVLLYPLVRHPKNPRGVSPTCPPCQRQDRTAFGLLSFLDLAVCLEKFFDRPLYIVRQPDLVHELCGLCVIHEKGQSIPNAVAGLVDRSPLGVTSSHATNGSNPPSVTVSLVHHRVTTATLRHRPSTLVQDRVRGLAGSGRAARDPALRQRGLGP